MKTLEYGVWLVPDVVSMLSAPSASGQQYFVSRKY